MRFRFYALFGILFLFCLIVDLLTFGGLACEPVTGTAIARSARAEAPLMHSYIVAGRPIATAIPALNTAGQSIADAAFGGKDVQRRVPARVPPACGAEGGDAAVAGELGRHPHHAPAAVPGEVVADRLGFIATEQVKQLGANSTFPF